MTRHILQIEFPPSAGMASVFKRRRDSILTVCVHPSILKFIYSYQLGGI